MSMRFQILDGGRRGVLQLDTDRVRIEGRGPAETVTVREFLTEERFNHFGSPRARLAKLVGPVDQKMNPLWRPSGRGRFAVADSLKDHIQKIERHVREPSWEEKRAQAWAQWMGSRCLGTK